MKVTIFFVILILGACVAPKFLIPTNLSEYGDNGVVAQGYSLASRSVYDNPIGRLLYTKIRVDSVYYQPGTCDRGTTESYDSVVVLKVHGLFGLPMRTLEAFCAGGQTRARAE